MMITLRTSVAPLTPPPSIVRSPDAMQMPSGYGNRSYEPTIPHATVRPMVGPGRTARRCAVHPSRPAVDACPVCDRARCGPDAQAWPAGGCLVCRGGGAAAAPTPPQHVVERLVAAALVSSALALLGGLVCSEYV